MRLSIVLSATLLAACGGGGSGGEAPNLPTSAAEADTPIASGERPLPEPGPANPVLADPTGPEQGASRDSVIDTDNYVSLTAFAVQTNIVVLATRALSPTRFLERFPGNPEAGFASVSEDELEERVLEGDCPLGGTYRTVGESASTVVRVTGTYVGCETEVGILDGTYSVESGFGGSIVDDAYDLELDERDGPDGPATTVFRASYEAGRFESLSFEIEAYSRDTASAPFSVAGTGRRSLDFADPDGSSSIHDIDTSIALLDTAGSSVELEFVTRELSVGGDTLSAGTLSLTAADGSRVDVTAGDTPETVSLTLVDRAGTTFSDTLAWSELYRLPE